MRNLSNSKKSIQFSDKEWNSNRDRTGSVIREIEISENSPSR